MCPSGVVDGLKSDYEATALSERDEVSKSVGRSVGLPRVSSAAEKPARKG